MVPKSWFLSVYPASLLATIPPALARTEWRLKTRMNQDGNVNVCSVTQSCLILCNFMDSSLTRLFHLWNFPGNSGVDCHSLLQGIFLTQGLSPHLFLLLQWLAVSLPLPHLGSQLECIYYSPDCQKQNKRDFSFYECDSRVLGSLLALKVQLG